MPLRELPFRLPEHVVFSLYTTYLDRGNKAFPQASLVATQSEAAQTDGAIAKGIGKSPRASSH